MAIEDKIKWDKKYKETSSLLKDRPHSRKLEELVNKVKGTKALEIACGTGRNSVYLAQNGFQVDAMDISEVALQFLDKKGYENITTKLVDLEGLVPQSDSYDIIVKTNYLDRNIIPYLGKALKKGGVLFIETYMHHESNTKPGSNPDYLLKAGELKTFFDNSYEVVDYDEFDNEPFERYRMKKQSIIVKKLQAFKKVI